MQNVAGLIQFKVEVELIRKMIFGEILLLVTKSVKFEFSSDTNEPKYNAP